MPFVAPVDQIAQKRKVVSSLMAHQRETRPTSLTTPTCAQSRLKGRYRNFITPPLDNITDLPRELSSQRRQQLPQEMGAINMGLVDDNLPSAALILTHFHGELYQQVHIDSSVTIDTCHTLLGAMLGEDYRVLVPNLCSPRKRRDSS